MVASKRHSDLAHVVSSIPSPKFISVSLAAVRDDWKVLEH
jgi:hypothetical protein